MTIIPPTAPEVVTARDVLAKAPEGDIYVALMAGSTEFISRKPLEFHPYWEVQALPGGGDSPFHGTGETLHEALVECGVQTPNTATRVKELSEPSPLDRALETLATFVAEIDDSGVVLGMALAAVIAARHGLPAREAIALARGDHHDELTREAGGELRKLAAKAQETSSPVPVLRRAAEWLDDQFQARVSGWNIRTALEKSAKTRVSGQAALGALSLVWDRDGGFDWTPSRVHAKAEVMSRLRDAADVIEMVESGVELDVAVAS